MRHIPIRDIKLASILSGLGIPYRKSDPVTCVVSTENGVRKEQYSFWFELDASSQHGSTETLIRAYQAAYQWAEYLLPQEHPLYYIKAGLENREIFLHWIRQKVEPMKIYQNGNQTILIGEKASQALKDKVKGLINK